MDPVQRYEVTVNQVLGDGIIALFGAPIAHEDHIVEADQRDVGKFLTEMVAHRPRQGLPL